MGAAGDPAPEGLSRWGGGDVQRGRGVLGAGRPAQLPAACFGAGFPSKSWLSTARLRSLFGGRGVRLESRSSTWSSLAYPGGVDAGQGARLCVLSSCWPPACSTESWQPQGCFSAAFGILLSPVPQPCGGKGRFAPGRLWLGCAGGSAGPCPLGCAEEEEEERAARKAERDGEAPRALGDWLVPAN